MAPVPLGVREPRNHHLDPHWPQKGLAMHQRTPMLAGPPDRAATVDFVGLLSHELRTPVTSIYGGAHLLLDDGLDPATKADIARDIAAEAEVLEGLVEDLLAIVRVQGGLADDDPEPVPLPRVAADAALAEMRRWRGRTVEVRTQPDLPPLRIHEQDLRLILRDLISDALRHAPADSVVVVEAWLAEDDAVDVAVQDRSPDATTDAGQLRGIGIGRFVARALAEAHGGRLRVRRRPSGGTTVTVSLPAWPTAEGALGAGL